MAGSFKDAFAEAGYTSLAKSGAIQTLHLQRPPPISVPSSPSTSPAKHKSATFSAEEYNRRLDKHWAEERLMQLRQNRAQLQNTGSELKTRQVQQAKSTTPVRGAKSKSSVQTSALPTLLLTPQARCLLSFGMAPDIPSIPHIEKLGSRTQLTEVQTGEQREMTIGVDFGTSNVKVVISDIALGKSFAVPFFPIEGINKYLLPSHVHEQEGVFSLDGEGEVHRDLKLAYFERLALEEHRIRIAAFLALVIRRSRGWLFGKQSNLYKNTRLLWNFSVGIPRAYHRQTRKDKDFQKICMVAWAAANETTPISKKRLQKLFASLEKDIPAPPSEGDAEIMVIPEIAAQIYGFVVSNSFDSRVNNIYLMADVGAGTLDASLFFVKKIPRTKKWNFSFYTSEIEPYGTSNLHRYRVDWWCAQLAKAKAPDSLYKSLKDIRDVTDQQAYIPESYLDYFSGVEVHSINSKCDPDVEFYNKVIDQVRGRAYYDAFKNNLLSSGQLSGIPFFLCGGGARMSYYQKIYRSLAQPTPSASWLSTQQYALVPPGDLEVSDINEVDYDRLSVAYGLSRLRVNDIRDVKPLSMAQQRVGTPIRAVNYISKDDV